MGIQVQVQEVLLTNNKADSAYNAAYHLPDTKIHIN